MSTPASGAPVRGTKTHCPHCSARVRSRVWVDDDPALFVETYECGSALAYGVVEKSRQTIRDCVNPLG